MAEVSIIIPCLNQRDFLAHAIDSVRRLDGTLAPGVEVVVVDGGSTDGSLELAEQRDDILCVSRQLTNVAEAVNVGLQMSDGDIIGWLNADDFYRPGTIDFVRTFFAERPQLDVLYGISDHVDIDGDMIRPGSVQPWNPNLLHRSCVINPPAAFVRRAALDKFGGLDESICYWADYELWLRLSQSEAQFAHTTQILGARRAHPGNRRFHCPHRRFAVESISEAIRMLKGRLGSAHASWVRKLGEVQSELELRDDPRLRGYARLAFQRSLEAERRLNGRTGSMLWIATIHALGLTYQELRNTFRQPHRATRFLPESLAQFSDHFRRRVFKLRQYPPRPMHVPDKYHQVELPPDPPTISIVTPNLNQGPHLEATLKSVLDQQYPRLQYIVQDGGSTDESLDVVRRYNDRLARWESTADNGQADAINRGMQHAHGELMAFLNSDDLLLPGSLRYVANYFREHPEVDVVYGHRVLVDEGGDEIGRWVLPAHDPKVLCYADYVPQETMFWRRSAWQQVGSRLDDSFQFALDWDLILRFQEAGLNFARLPRFLGAFRVTDDQKTSALIETMGRREMKRLRRRVLGRIPTQREVQRAVRPYMWRHWLCHSASVLGLLRH